MTEIYVDADGCPVKEEALRVAERHKLVMHVVSDRWQRGLDHPLVRKVVVAQGPDAADDWIAARIGGDDVALTNALPLARRVPETGEQIGSASGREREWRDGE